MKRYSLSHLSDHTLLRDLAALVARDRVTTAELLAHIAEVDARKLYLPAAYPSMYAYCVGALRLSEEAAFKRIHAARAARRFPAIFEAVAQGRLHLSAVVQLAPHLTEHTAEELLAAAAHKTKAEIERLLAERFPRPDLLAWVEGIPARSGSGWINQQALGPVESQHAPGRVGEPPQLVPEQVGAGPQWDRGPVADRLLPEQVAAQHAPGHVQVQHAPGRVEVRSKVTPLAPQRFAVQCTINQRAHDQLRYAQALLGHQVPSGDLGQLFERALDALIPQLERAKFAATERPRSGGRRSRAGSRHIPAHIKRAVWERDQGQCTFVSETGRRCPARARLEFDHVHEFARGGEATVAGIRLRCRAYNQYGAERTFGADFMRRRRLATAERRSAAQAHASAEMRGAPPVRVAAKARAPVRAPVDAMQNAARVREQAAVAEPSDDRDVIPWLRQLGFSASEARRASAHCEDIPDASLEERVRRALSYFHVKGRTIRPVEASETVARGHTAHVPAARQA